MRKKKVDFDYVASLVDNALRPLLNEWAESDPETFVEACGEFCQGNSGESYFMARNRFISRIPDFDEIPVQIVLNELERTYILTIAKRDGFSWNQNSTDTI